MSSVALSYAINLLARREYSEFELRHKMQDKNFSEEDITAVIDHCQRKNCKPCTVQLFAEGRKKIPVA